MFKNKYEADNSRFGEVLTQVLSAHGIGVRQFLAEAKVGKTRFYAVKRGQGDARKSATAMNSKTLVHPRRQS